MGRLVRGTGTRRRRQYDSTATWQVDARRPHRPAAAPVADARARRPVGADRARPGIPAALVPVEGIGLTFAGRPRQAGPPRLHLADVEPHDVPAAAEGRAGPGRGRLPRSRTLMVGRARVGAVTILDDARDGHEPRHPPAGRPLRPRQRPLARRDRDPRRPVELGAVRPARRRRRAAGPRRSSRSSPTAGRDGLDEDAPQDRRPLRLLHGRPATIDAPGLRPVAAAARRGRRAARRAATSRRFLGEFERIGGHGLFGSYVDTDDRGLRPLPRLPRPGRPRAARRVLLPRGQVRRDPRRSTSPTSTACSGSPATPTPSRRPRRVLALETRLAAGPLGARGDPRRPEDLQPARRSPSCASSCPAFDWDAYVTDLGGTERDASHESCVRQPSYFAHLSTVLDEAPIEDWQAWLACHVLRSAAPYLPTTFVEANFDFYGRTLSGTPELRERWKRGVALVEGAHRRGRRPGSTSRGTSRRPPRQRMDELVANLVEAYRRSHLLARLDEPRTPSSRRSTSSTRSPRRSATPTKWRDYSALADRRRRPARQRARAASAFEIDRKLAKIGQPGRPRRVVHDAADRQRLLQPAA